MPENYISRPDLSAANASRQNEKISPNVISDVGTTFGAPIVPIHFYNVSALGWEDIHQICRPPVFPHVFLRGCPEGQRYIKACQDMQHPYPQAFEGQNGEKLVRYVDGYIEASKFLCPENPGTDQDFSIQNGLNIGNNLNEYGVFWSVNEPPKQEEIDAAIRRMEKTYERELARMADIEARDPQNCHQAANRVSHAAAEYFKQSVSWHRRDYRKGAEENKKIECRACAEKIQPRAKICLHCGAPQEDRAFERWFEQQLGGRGPGRPRKEEAA